MTNQILSAVSVATVTGVEVHRLIDKMEPVLEGESIFTVIVACLTIALMGQNPYLTTEELEEGVSRASEVLAEFAAEKDLVNMEVSKEKFN